MASNLLKQIESDGVSHGGTHVHHFSLANSLYNLTYLTPAIPRDSVMYLNHKALSRALSLEDEKIHGLWGFFHTFQISMQRVRHVMPFAATCKVPALPSATRWCR